MKSQLFLTLYFDFITSIIQNTTNTTAFTITTLAPVGVSREKDAHIPIKKQQIDITPEHIITDLNFLQIRIDDTAGKIISAEINSVPIILIPITIVSAVSRATAVL